MTIAFLSRDQLDKMPTDRSQVLQPAFLLDQEKGCSQAEGSYLSSFRWSCSRSMHLYLLFDLGLLIFEELPANKIHLWIYLAAPYCGFQTDSIDLDPPL